MLKRFSLGVTKIRLFSSNELRHRKDTALKLRIPLNLKSVPAVMAIEGKEGYVQGIDYRGIEVLSVIKAVPNSPWFMIAKEDRAEALAVWKMRSFLIVSSVYCDYGLTHGRGEALSGNATPKQIIRSCMIVRQCCGRLKVGIVRPC